LLLEQKTSSVAFLACGSYFKGSRGYFFKNYYVLSGGKSQKWRKRGVTLFELKLDGWFVPMNYQIMITRIFISKPIMCNSPYRFAWNISLESSWVCTLSEMMMMIHVMDGWDTDWNVYSIAALLFRHLLTQSDRNFTSIPLHHHYYHYYRIFHTITLYLTL